MGSSEIAGQNSDSIDSAVSADLKSFEISPSSWNLFLAGFLVLFLELACIRWFAVYVVFMQFFTNIILIACFLGMSIGCLCAGKKEDWLARFPWLAVMAVIFALATNALYNYWTGVAVGVGDQSLPEVVFFGTEYRTDLAKFVIPIEIPAGIFFVLIALMFVGPGQVLGKLFDSHPNRIIAYTSNIAGSLAGVAGFAAVSFLELPPVVWFLIAFGIIVLFLRRAGKLKLEGVAFLVFSLAVVMIADISFHKNTEFFWSPYYAIEYDEQGRSIRVNGIDHQKMVGWDTPNSEYSLIHFLNRDAGGPSFKDALIIGAGSGNDVAHSLANEVAHIDAVEIDPIIQWLGQQHHPDQPYRDPRVEVHLNDGRNFLRTTDKKYDLVIFALIDSLILHSSFSSVRLESFLFTQQAFRDARLVLKDRGVFVIYNFFRQGWVVQRIANMLESVFGEKPIVLSLPYVEEIKPDDFQGGSMTVFIAGDIEHLRTAFDQHGAFWLDRLPTQSKNLNGFKQQPLTSEHKLVKIAPAHMVSSTDSLEMATDDWPFLYLRSPSMPWLYLRSMLMTAGASFVLLFWLAPGHKVALNGRMFFLGAGFLLLETKAIVHLALVFGSTWIVNSMVFFVILVMILAANLYVLKCSNIKLQRHYLALFVCLVANCVIPMDIFLVDNLLWKYVAPCLLTMIPVFFAGVIFAVSFRASQRPDRDFGANIAGAVVGGLAEYASMACGFRYLLVIAIVFYALSSVFRIKILRK